MKINQNEESGLCGVFDWNATWLDEWLVLNLSRSTCLFLGFFSFEYFFVNFAGVWNAPKAWSLVFSWIKVKGLPSLRFLRNGPVLEQLGSLEHLLPPSFFLARSFQGFKESFVLLKGRNPTWDLLSITSDDIAFVLLKITSDNAIFRIVALKANSLVASSSSILLFPMASLFSFSPPLIPASWLWLLICLIRSNLLFVYSMDFRWKWVFSLSLWVSALQTESTTTIMKPSPQSTQTGTSSGPRSTQWASRHRRSFAFRDVASFSPSLSFPGKPFKFFEDFVFSPSAPIWKAKCCWIKAISDEDWSV